MANKYVGSAQFVGEKIIKPIVKSFTKKQKTTGKTVNPFERKKMRSNRDAIMGGLKVDLAKLKGGAKKIQTTAEDVKAAMRDRARIKKMGGGFAGRRMGYSQGSNGKIKFDAKKSDLDKSGSLSPYEKRRGMAIAKAMAKRKKKVI